jgi:hypothetical protein
VLLPSLYLQRACQFWISQRIQRLNGNVWNSAKGPQTPESSGRGDDALHILTNPLMLQALPLSPPGDENAA